MVSEDQAEIFAQSIEAELDNAMLVSALFFTVAAKSVLTPDQRDISGVHTDLYIWIFNAWGVPYFYNIFRRPAGRTDGRQMDDMDRRTDGWTDDGRTDGWMDG